MLTDATTIGFTGNTILEEFVTKMDGKRITGLGMGEDLHIGSVLQPGGITYGDLEVLEINLGRGIDHFFVSVKPYKLMFFIDINLRIMFFAKRLQAAFDLICKGIAHRN